MPLACQVGAALRAVPPALMRCSAMACAIRCIGALAAGDYVTLCSAASAQDTPPLLRALLALALQEARPQQSPGCWDADLPKSGTPKLLSTSFVGHREGLGVSKAQPSITLEPSQMAVLYYWHCAARPEMRLHAGAKPCALGHGCSVPLAAGSHCDSRARPAAQRQQCAGCALATCCHMLPTCFFSLPHRSASHRISRGRRRSFAEACVAAACVARVGGAVPAGLLHAAAQLANTAQTGEALGSELVFRGAAAAVQSKQTV